MKRTSTHRLAFSGSRIVAGSVLALFAGLHGAKAVTITYFAASTYSVDTAAMDANLGLASGYVFENFEDTDLVSGLTISFTGNGFNTAVSTLAATQSGSHATWAGAGHVINHPNNGPIANGTYASLTTFQFDSSSSVGIGLSGFQSLGQTDFPITNHYLYVNGVNLGMLESLAGSFWDASRLGRNVYLRVDAGSGEAITSIGFENIASPANANDVIAFDHLALRASSASSVPESGPTSLFYLAIVVLGGLQRLRNQSR